MPTSAFSQICSINKQSQVDKSLSRWC